MNTHPFRDYVDSLAWPEEIAHLKGKTLIRKKDRAKYRIGDPEHGQMCGKPTAWLVPVGAFTDGQRSHEKTHVAILKQFDFYVPPPSI